MRSNTRATTTAVAVSLSVFVAACGGGSSTQTVDPSTSPVDDNGAAEVAAENLADLAGNDDVRLVEVLDVTSGEPTTLADTVTGDRPVLLWFWAPH